MAVEYTAKGAILSPDQKYRYLLWREWRGSHDPKNWTWMYADQGVPKACVFIMLNPSTADGDIDDPTIRKCVGFAWRWDFERVEIVNLFAYRATKPGELLKADDPIGSDNLMHVRSALERAGRVLCAWGAHGGHLGQDRTMMGWLDAAGVSRPLSLGITRDGYPRHPLYVPYGNPLSRYISL